MAAAEPGVDGEELRRGISSPIYTCFSSPIYACITRVGRARPPPSLRLTPATRLLSSLHHLYSRHPKRPPSASLTFTSASRPPCTRPPVNLAIGPGGGGRTLVSIDPIDPRLAGWEVAKSRIVRGQSSPTRAVNTDAVKGNTIFTH